MEKNTREEEGEEITRINKSILLNWLYSAPKEVEIEELGRWILNQTNGKYILTKNI